MKRMYFLIAGCATLCTAPLVHADSPSVEQSLAADTAISAGVQADAIGQFHLIRVANTQLCVQPQGGFTGDAQLELQPCNAGLPEQNWLFTQTSSGFAIINNKSGKCIYDASDSPRNGSPVLHQGCTSSGTNDFASNALWKGPTTTGETTFMSRVRFRDSGFCLDVPWGNPFVGATLWIWSCNNTAAQHFIVGVE